MGQVIWIIISCVSVGVGIKTGDRSALAFGAMMYLLPLGIALLHYLKDKK